MPSSRICSLVLIACAACSPHTDLAAEQHAPSTPSSGATTGSDAGALFGLPKLVDPPAGAVQVPTNLAKVILGFFGPLQVSDVAAPLNLRASDGSEVALALGDTVSCGGTCYAAIPAAVLAAATSYAVEVVADALHLEGGKPVPAGQVGSFTTRLMHS
jgi:hypothetical protein